MKLRQFKELSLIGSADIIGNAISSIFWLYLSSQIAPEEYGEIFYFIGIVATASALVLIGNINTLTVYSSKNIKIESTLYLISLALGVVASFIIMIFFYRVDTILLLFGYIINILSMGELLGKRYYSTYSKHILLQKILTLVLGVSFFIIFGIEGILYALALSYTSFVIIIYKRFRETKIDFGLLKNRSLFIANNYAIELLTNLNSHLNKFIIVPLLGFGMLGNFSLALQIVNLGMIFTMIVFKYTIAYDAQNQENKKLKKITFMISIGIALIGMFIAPLIIPIFFPQYGEAVDAIRILSLSIIPMTLTRIYSSKLLGKENNKQIVLSKIIAIITFIVTIVILSVPYGIVGLAIGYLLSTIAESVCLIPKLQLIKK